MIAPELDEFCSKVILRPSLRPNTDCPWCNSFEYRGQPQNILLHREILDFARWMQPTDDEKKLRFSVINRFRTAVKMRWPHSSIVCHGSSATGTYLPGGDIDLVFINPPPDLSEVEMLNELNNHFCSLNMFRNSEVLENARCPIIKGVEKPFGFHIDIAVNNVNGILNIQRNKNLMKKHHALYPLLILLKFFLFQNRLHEPFTGGISTNTLQQMIVFIIQSSPNDKKIDLGYLLLRFFQVFGTFFNYITTGISTRNDGCLFNRIDYDRVNWKSPINLCVEDPQFPGHFIGENAFDTPYFRSKCYNAYHNLSNIHYNSQSLLLKIINRPDWTIRYRQDIKKQIDGIQGNIQESIPLIPDPNNKPYSNNRNNNFYNTSFKSSSTPNISMFNDSRRPTDYRRYNEKNFGEVLRYNDEHQNHNDRRPFYRR